MKSIRYSVAVAAALLILPAVAAQAQTAPAQQSMPQPTDVKEYGDWSVRCYPVKSASPCEMLELRVAKKGGQRVLGVLLAYVPSQNDHVMQISVPLGVSLQSGLVIDTDTYKSGTLKYRRCDYQGCYVERPIDNKSVDSLGRATKAKTKIVYMNGKNYDLEFSLKGFNEAHKAMVELAKQKAVAPAAENAPAPEAAKQ